VQLSALIGDAAKIIREEPGDAGLSWEREVLLGQQQQTARGRPGPSWRNLKEKCESEVAYKAADQQHPEGRDT